MARLLRVEFPGAIYHVTCRMLGDTRSCLFKNDADRERFLDRLGERVDQFNIRLYLFVLMNNHFHLVLETPEGNSSKFMQSLTTSYVVYYNLRHRRHGHLLDGRYKAKLVDGDKYLLALSRYVHLNPVKVAGVRDMSLEEKIHYLHQYRWSSYQSYIGKRKKFTCIECGPILAEMSGPQVRWPRQYRRFVEKGIAEEDSVFSEALKESPKSIGSDHFRAWVDEQYQVLLEGHHVSEDISFRRITEPLSPNAILSVVAGIFGVKVEGFKRRRRDSCLRAVASKLLLRYAGMTQREVALLLNIGSGSAVSQQIKKLRERLPADRELNRRLKCAEKALSELRQT